MVEENQEPGQCEVLYRAGAAAGVVHAQRKWIGRTDTSQECKDDAILGYLICSVNPQITREKL